MFRSVLFRRPGPWVAALGLVGAAGRVHAQRSVTTDSAIILTVPSQARGVVTCSTSVSRVVTVNLDIWAGPLADERLAIGTFDTTGRALTLRDAGFRVTPRVRTESAMIRFDPMGGAREGVGQDLTPDDFHKDSTGALHQRDDRRAFHTLTRTQLAQAESVSAWLWRQCRSVNHLTRSTSS